MSNDASIVRVLVVDDDRDDYEATCEILQQIGDGSGYQAVWARTSDEALGLLRVRTFDVCLCDYRLGPADGIELMTEAVLAGFHVPFILVTGQGTTGIEHRALEAGAADYLIKGKIFPDSLERSIRHSLERGRAMRALSESERQFRALFHSALEAMFIIDDEGRFLDANEAGVRLTGVSRAQQRLLRISDFTPPAEAARVARDWETLRRDGQFEGEQYIRRPDGQLRCVEIRCKANFTPGKHLVVLRDVTGRREAEAVRLRLAAMVESAADSIEGLTLDGIIDYWSPASEAMFGCPRHDAIGKSKRLFVPEDRLEEYEQMLARAAKGDAVRNIETVRRRLDGSIFSASTTLSPVLQDGEIIALSVITRDISEKKKMEAHVAESDRMASVGTLAAGVAHEINNPLAAVIANLEFLNETVQNLVEEVGQGRAALVAHLVAELKEPMSDAREASHRVREVVKDLRLFSRKDDEVRGPVDMHRVIESTLRLAWNEVRHRARLVKDFGKDVAPVTANESRLGQVFLNLVVNAAHAIPEGKVQANEIRISTGMRDGSVVIDVRDTGSGMPPEVAKRLFEPFFTTKPAGLGTGLGLSICRRIVHETGGTISVESVVGQGTTFHLVFPAAREDTVSAQVLPKTIKRAARRGAVLVVDDEILVAHAVRRALAHDHDVVAVHSGAEALERLRGGDRFDVIICDLMMPQMTGMEFHQELARSQPTDAERVVFLTGGTFTPNARQFLEDVPNQRIEKPFDSTHLRAVVNDRLRS